MVIFDRYPAQLFLVCFILIINLKLCLELGHSSTETMILQYGDANPNPNLIAIVWFG